MEGFGVLGEKPWRPLSYFGLKHSFFDINYSTVLSTWITIGIMLLILIPIYIVLKRKPGLFHFAITSFVNYFANLTKQSLGFFSFKHFSFITALFMFISLCNIISIIPGIEEPTQNLSTTLAFGVIQFFYIQYYEIKAHGPLSYIKEYFSPFFLMLPLNLVGKIASIVSISFRLFGNIFGGVIISDIYFGGIKGSIVLESIGLLSGLNFLIKFFFGLFEGLLQAFVFTMLTITYLSIAVQKPDKPKSSGESQ